MEPLPKKIDPNDITARISFLYLGELGCPNFDPPIPDNLTPAEYKEELLVAQGSMRKHEYADAIKRLDRLVVSHPNEELPRLKRAAALCQYRRYDQALKTIEELLVQNVRSAQYAVARGQLLFRLRRYEEAARAFHAAAMQSPGSAEYYWGEGDSLRMAHRCATAIEAFTRAIQLDPRYTDAYLSRAECYQQIGKASLALSDISTAILLDTGSVRAHQLLSDTYRIMASDRRLSAQADYRVLADEAERETTELRRLSDNRAKDQQPRLDCGDVEVGDPENERACTRYTFDIYFERGESYLTQKAIGEINGLLPIASSCERMIIRVTGYADPGEDDYSDGKDLASSREQILSWVFMETLGRGGVYELTLLDNYYVDRMSDTDGLIAIYSGSFGYDKRPVRGPTSTVDERNQVAQVVLTCDGRRTTH
jgi:tetratricopeptide (TPR) repeat protein